MILTWPGIRPLIRINGLFLLILAGVQIPPMLVDYWHDHTNWQVFAVSIFIALTVGGTLFLATSDNITRLSKRQAFLLTTSLWLILPLFSAIPFMLAKVNLPFHMAYFEAMSGLTTTGATVMTGLDMLPPGLLLWRSLLQGLGGVGVIVIALAVLPALQIGGMQIFKTESSDNSQKIIPKVEQVANGIAGVYVLLLTLCAIGYHVGGMPWFDAINHALTTVSTGGFSTHDASFGYFASLNPNLEWVAITFMLLASLPLILYAALLGGNSVSHITGNTQIRAFLFIFAAGCFLVWMGRLSGGVDATGAALRQTIFNTLSVLSGTGYASDNYSLWPNLSFCVLFFLMFCGGCAGSACGGLKTFRLQIMLNQALSQLRQVFQPHGIFRAYYQKRPVQTAVSQAVISFFLWYFMLYLLIVLGLSAFGLDTITALSGAVATLANVGAGLGDVIGPAGNYGSLPQGAIWIMSAAMVLGRLELFTVLVLFLPAFWRR